MEEQRGTFVSFYNYFAKNAIEERIESIMKLSQKSLLVTVLAIGLMMALSMSAFAAASMEPSIAYRDLSTAATQIERDAILAARYEIIYFSGPWTTTGAKIIKTDGTLVDVPDFYDLFPEDWELPTATSVQTQVWESQYSGPEKIEIYPSVTWSIPHSTYSASFNGNVYLPLVTSSTDTETAPFYSPRVTAGRKLIYISILSGTSSRPNRKSF